MASRVGHIGTLNDKVSVGLHASLTISIALYGSMLWSGFARVAVAKVNVTESFDIGFGTRFDTFVGNNPAPISAPGIGTPDDMSEQEMGFGPEILDFNALKTNQFGLTTTNFVGQANGSSSTGEFGGQFSWFSYGYGADTNIGNLALGSATFEDPIKIQANAIMFDYDWKNDETVTLGYFKESGSNTVGDADDLRRSSSLNPSSTIIGGIGIIGDGRFFLYLNGANTPDVYDYRFHPDPVGPGTGAFDIDLSIYCEGCDDGSGDGVIEGTVNGNEVFFTTPVTGNEAMGNFGIGQAYLRPVMDHWRHSITFFDDVTYTVETDGGIDNADPFRFEMAVTGNSGDYNGDGIVDAADYTVWRNNFGTTGTAGSVVGDGTSDDLLGVPDGNVDEFDYSYWKSQYGTVLEGSGAGGLAVVPEPTGLLLLLFGSFGFGILRRRSQILD